MSTRKPFHETVAQKLIEQLEAGTAPWQKPWKSGQINFMPMNPTTGVRYKGVNALHLMSQGFDDTRWMTYKQAQSTGAQVKRGEKSTQVQYWMFHEERHKRDDSGKPVFDEQQRPVKEVIKLERPKVFTAHVFNAEQIEGLAAPVIPKKTWDELDKAEHILNASGAIIKHEFGDRAYYRPSTDVIHLPEKAQFESADRYYATALHELGHWTGHSSRLNRDLQNPFGSEAYAKEELRAEIASLMIGNDIGIGHDPGQHASYVASWIKVLREDPLEIFRASADAEKIQSFVLGISPHEQKQTNELQKSQGMIMNAEKTESILKILESHDLKQSIEQHKQATSQDSLQRFYIQVPFAEKDEAKQLGAKWDRQQQSWYVPKGQNVEPFSRWASVESGTQNANQPKRDANDRVYLAVPYTERQEAKKLGAQWDKAAKSWFVNKNVDLAHVKKWLPNIGAEQLPALTPREEFRQALQSVGAIISGDHPIMDGSKHRIETQGDRHGEKAGFYIGHLDGHPAGYIKNNRTGEEIRWKSKGYALSSHEKAQLAAEAAQRKSEKQKLILEKQIQVSQKVSEQLKSLIPISNSLTPYLEHKKISVNQGIFTDQEGLKTYIPAYDSNGKQWSMQYIQEDGTKRFAKDSKKEGSFHVVGGFESLKQAATINIAEGYATAATVSEVLNQPVVAAFDSGNLKPVAEALREKHPDKMIVIFGDDDQHLQLTQGQNPGREKAEEAALAVNGYAIFPQFSSTEASYPKDLEPITPEQYKKHIMAKRELELNPSLPSQNKSLSALILHPEQLKALNKMKSFTDFNDLKTKAALGPERISRQLKVKIPKMQEKKLPQTLKKVFKRK